MARGGLACIFYARDFPQDSTNGCTFCPWRIEGPPSASSGQPGRIGRCHGLVDFRGESLLPIPPGPANSGSSLPERSMNRCFMWNVPRGKALECDWLPPVQAKHVIRGGGLYPGARGCCAGSHHKRACGVHLLLESDSAVCRVPPIHPMLSNVGSPGSQVSIRELTNCTCIFPPPAVGRLEYSRDAQEQA